MNIRLFQCNTEHFTCCPLHKFVTKAILCTFNIFTYLACSMQLNNTENALLCFHCKSGYANAPHL